MTSSAKVSTEDLRLRLKLKSFRERRQLSKKHPNAHKFFSIKNFDLSKVRNHSAKLLSAGALAGALLLTPPSSQNKLLPTPIELLEKLEQPDKNTGSNLDGRIVLIDKFNAILPDFTRPLSAYEENELESVFNQVFKVSAKASLDGNHLNTTYGYIGAEQHLVRYPGDSLDQHKEFLQSGIAPGKGAWGYFAPSKADLSDDLEQKEKWYAVVQTLYLPEWNKNHVYLREWYKYRKVLIVNRENGNAVVADIADSGPAAFTGKQFGGSPEVMNYLGGHNYKKGKVIVFFVDDPENTISLGPISSAVLTTDGPPKFVSVK